MTSTTTRLLEINSAFPAADMPASDRLVFHQSGCAHCEYAREELEELRGKDVTLETLRWFHQDLGCLSPETIRWILPYYLRYGLTPESQHDGVETEFLIYNLSPSAEYRLETVQHLSLLNQAQIACLIHFVEWCSEQEHWREYFLDDLREAIIFL